MRSPRLAATLHREIKPSSTPGANRRSSASLFNPPCELLLPFLLRWLFAILPIVTLESWNPTWPRFDTGHERIPGKRRGSWCQVFSQCVRNSIGAHLELLFKVDVRLTNAAINH
ncbi:hypothetical protein RRG08_032863 [Elysia crispata]|uniref:Uncharacterized protein n=1 Tax=Elysia crispata TaxID=231223 RepID=A0AAE0ZK50_9GAST|nr:hypothetical protein RRG08_032863 [Elysia crispata]